LWVPAWAGTAVLLGMLVMVRNAYGALSLVLTGAVVVAIFLWARRTSGCVRRRDDLVPVVRRGAADR
jgi:hypothetical protein